MTLSGQRPENEKRPHQGFLYVLLSAFFMLPFLFWSKRDTSAKNSTVGVKSKEDGIRADDETHAPPPPVVHSKQACECCHHKIPTWKIVLDWLTLFATGGAFLAATIYACITYQMWKEMRTQTNTAREQLELSERPWIKITDVKTLGNNALIPAFSFQGFGHGVFPQGTKQATLQLRMSFKNIGHSLAFVNADFELFFPPWKDSFEDVILAEEKRYCAISAKRIIKTPPSQIVFPDEQLEWAGAGVQLVAPPVEPNAYNRSLDGQPGDYVLPVIIVCANYTFPASTSKYQTKAMYVVVHQATGNRFFKVPEDVPERNLRMIRDELADDAY